MLKKTILTIVLAVLLIPAINLSAEEKKAENYLATQHQVKQQPGKKQLRTRIRKLEQRLEHMEQLLERTADRRPAMYQDQDQDNRPPKGRPQRQQRHKRQQRMQEWFEQLEQAYDENDMEKIGRLIKKSKKFREQMKKRRGEFREKHPQSAERFGRGFGRRGQPCGGPSERSCGGGRQGRGKRSCGGRQGQGERSYGGCQGGRGQRNCSGQCRGGGGCNQQGRGQCRHRQEQQRQDYDRDW